MLNHQPDKLRGGISSLPIPGTTAPLNNHDMRDLLRVARSKGFDKGAFIYRSGDPDDHVYFLRYGKVKLYRVSAAGREIIVRFCTPGDSFGLTQAMNGGRRHVNAYACERSRVMFVSREQFAAYLQTHNDVSLVVMQMLSKRVQTLEDLAADLMSDDVSTRILKLIWRLCASNGSRSGEDVCIAIPLTHQDIASMVGAARQTVTILLSRLKQQGLIRFDNRHICIESDKLAGIMNRLS